MNLPRNPSIRRDRTVNFRSVPHCLVLLLSLLTLAPPLAAQDQRYVSDEVFIVLHAGPGANYRWLGKLTPGAQLTIRGTSGDGEWTEVLTARGTEGWVQSEYLASEPPAQVRLPALSRQLEDAVSSSTSSSKLSSSAGAASTSSTTSSSCTA